MKNWTSHAKLHAILKHQQKIQAEIDQRQTSGQSATSSAGAKAKLYRPTTLTSNSDNTSTDSGNLSGGAIYSNPPIGSPGKGMAIAYPVSPIARIFHNIRLQVYAKLAGPRRYVALILALVLVTILMQFHFSGAFRDQTPPNEHGDVERIVVEGSSDDGETIQNLKDKIKKLEATEKKHEQQLNYILDRFVEKIPNFDAKQVTDRSGNLPNDLVAKPDKSAGIRAELNSRDATEKKGFAGATADSKADPEAFAGASQDKKEEKKGGFLTAENQPKEEEKKNEFAGASAESSGIKRDFGDNEPEKRDLEAVALENKESLSRMKDKDNSIL